METRGQRYEKKHGAKPFFKAFFVGVVRYFGWKVESSTRSVLFDRRDRGIWRRVA